MARVCGGVGNRLAFCYISPPPTNEIIPGFMFGIFGTFCSLLFMVSSCSTSKVIVCSVFFFINLIAKIKSFEHFQNKLFFLLTAVHSASSTVICRLR